MVADGTRLEFTAEIANVKTIATKKSAGYGADAGGKLELTLVVEMPKAVRKPGIPWEWKAASGGADAWKDRPSDVVERRKNESDDSFAVRTSERERYDEARDRYERLMRDWRVANAAHSQRVMAYAQLVGIAAVFGGQKLRVMLVPENQDMLPGFEVELLDALPAGAEGDGDE